MWLRNCLRSLSLQLSKHVADRRVQHRKLERFENHRCINPSKEKLHRRIVLVTSKKNEALTSSRPDPRHRPIKHLAPHARHHHIAKEEIEAGVHDLTQTLDAAID